jgi:hypothetical protein
MKKIGRNDPCPCGSGRKFKKCHMGKEDELVMDGTDEFPEEMSALIAHLPEVNYGRFQEMADALDIVELTGKAVGIKCVDLKKYTNLALSGSSGTMASAGKNGGVFINRNKTVKADPDHVYLAVSPGIDDSTLIHELAHVLDYLGGSELMPGTLGPLSYELDLPVDHLEHPEEFGYWLNFLKRKFDVQLDADDTIISYLFENNMLIKGEDIKKQNTFALRSKSGQIFKFLSERSAEINALICELPGYIGSREGKN